MDHDAVEDVLSTVRRFMGLKSTPEEGLNTGGMNQPWILARCHSLFLVILPLLHQKNVPSSPTERCRLYTFLRDSLEQTLSLIRTLRLRSRVKDENGDAAEVVIRTAAQILASAVLTSKTADDLRINADNIRTFAGMEAQRNMEEFDELAMDTELRLLHKAAELLDIAAPAMHRSAMAHRRQMEKTELETYDHARQLLTIHYQELADEYTSQQ